MNLLITNSQEIQAYTIMRSLRPFARKVVITVGGDSVNHTGFEGMCRIRVSSTRCTPCPTSPGTGSPAASKMGTPTPRKRISCASRRSVPAAGGRHLPVARSGGLRVREEQAAVAALGVVTVVPEAEMIRAPMDKGLTMRAAQRVGFPCPKTYFPESADDVARIAAESRPPWIVKPRFTAHGLNMVLVEAADELVTAFAKVSESHRSPIIQEYIAGTQRQNYYVMVDRRGAILSLFSPRSARVNDWGGYRVSTKTAVSRHRPRLTSTNCAHCCVTWASGAGTQCRRRSIPATAFRS